LISKNVPNFVGSYDFGKDIIKNKTEKSFSPIGCSINDQGLYGLYYSKSETRRQEDKTTRQRQKNMGLGV